jgi:hypothetical protein
VLPVPAYKHKSIKIHPTPTVNIWPISSIPAHKSPRSIQTLHPPHDPTPSRLLILISRSPLILPLPCRGWRFPRLWPRAWRAAPLRCATSPPLPGAPPRRLQPSCPLPAPHHCAAPPLPGAPPRRVATPAVAPSLPLHHVAAPRATADVADRHVTKHSAMAGLRAAAHLHDGLLDSYCG